MSGGAAPEGRAPPGGARPLASITLAFVAGAVDGLGYVLLGVFTAHITGNTVKMGTALGREELAAAGRAGFAIAAFVTGAIGGAMLRDALRRRRGPARAAVLAADAVLLCGVVALGAGVGFADRIGPGRWEYWATAALAALAMGSQNTVSSRLGGARVRTFVTGMMTEFADAIAARLAARDPADARAAIAAARAHLALWIAYAAGGVVSGVATVRWGAGAGALPAVLLAAVVASDLAHFGHAMRQRRTGRPVEA